MHHIYLATKKLDVVKHINAYSIFNLFILFFSIDGICIHSCNLAY